MSTDHRTRRAWVEIDAGALRRNYREIVRAVGPNLPVTPLVKADAYGLGALEVTRVLRAEGASRWGVATVAEGVALRRAGVTEPVAVYSPTLPEEFAEAIDHDLTLTLSDLAALDAFERVAEALASPERPAAFQIEVDTGMGRAGFMPHEIEQWADRVAAAARRPSLHWGGLLTHLHSADERGGPMVLEQYSLFRDVVVWLTPPEGCATHVANSAGVFRLGSRSGGVRPGVFLYGGGVGPDQPAPEPVVSVRARVVRVRTAAPGSFLGYGATYQAPEPERWATLAIGYADGLPRALGGRGFALLQGRRVPLIGRISMDMAVANISGLDGVEPGDIATLVGTDGTESLTLDDVAGLAGTISYELLTGLGARLPRIWKGSADG